MDLRELGYFVAVFEEGSVSAAARRSFISQPSVSAALAALEAELGATLFVRHRQGVTPTAAAARLYPTARRLIAEAQALRASFRAPAPARTPLALGLMRSLDAARGRELPGVLAVAALDERLADQVGRAQRRPQRQRVRRRQRDHEPLRPQRPEGLAGPHHAAADHPHVAALVGVDDPQPDVGRLARGGDVVDQVGVAAPVQRRGRPRPRALGLGQRGPAPRRPRALPQRWCDRHPASTRAGPRRLRARRCAWLDLSIAIACPIIQPAHHAAGPRQ